MSRPSIYRVAIVGFGPRGFGCLERLAIEVARHGPDGLPILVTAHDPLPHPGAGPPYDPAQPEFLLLNFSACHVDIWSDDNDLLPRRDRPDFLHWLGDNHEKWASSDAFVPRRLLGCYLRDSLARLLAALPDNLEFRQVHGEVQDLELTDQGWTIRHDDLTLDLEGVDQVMVATGHGTWSGNRGFESWTLGLPTAPNTRRIPSVYPVLERLSRERIPDDAVVGIRGFALTAIDAALALTEGRGDAFEERECGIPRYRPLYPKPGGARLTIVPFSRSGLPPLAKPGAALTERSNQLTTVWEPLRQEILDAEGLTPETLLQRIHHAAAQAVVALGGQAAGALSRGKGLIHKGPLGIMERSALVACGTLPPDRVWAQGEAWRQAYPAVVVRSGEGGLAASFPAAFVRLASTMERYAFGPPATTLARIVALALAGRLELRAVRAPRIQSRQGHLVLHGKGAPIPLDVLVNAVIPPAGVHEDRPLLLTLVQRGHASRAPGWECLKVSPSAASIGRNGRPTPGLSIVGRATEGWIVGNDTLSRTLHDHTRHWAERVFAQSGLPRPSCDPPGAGMLPSAP